MFGNSPIITDLGNDSIIKFWPSHLSKHKSSNLFKELTSTCEFSQSDVKVHGKVYKTPRLQCWMADDDVDADIYTATQPVPWNDSVLLIKHNIEELLDVEFDYVLLNYYRDGNDYISYHSDREAINEGSNIIASLSLGADRRFILRNIENNSNKVTTMLTNDSLIVMSGKTQIFWQHTVPKMSSVSQPRLNLTFRHS
jgi:alkylated DNA repair dioxygenase AlkB